MNGKIMLENYKESIINRAYNLWEISKFPAATTFGICNAFSKSNVNVEAIATIWEFRSNSAMHYYL